MATTSFLYHALGLQGYKHLSTEYHDGAIFHHVERVREKRTCSNCKAPWYELDFDGAFERTFRALPVGRRQQWVVLHGHEQACKRCNKTLREPIPFSHGKSRHLKAFARYVVELCCIMTLRNVSRLLGVSWDLVKGLHKSSLSNRLKKRRLSKVRYIAADEFSTHKGGCRKSALHRHLRESGDP
jgi:hypothetical protein